MNEQPSIMRKAGRKPATNRAVTLSEHAYERLKADILAGVLPAGSSLKLQPLSERYDLSFSPVREALNRLQTEQLVIAMPLRGFCVAPYSADDLRDANTVRTLIETEAIRSACARGDDRWEAQIVATFHSLNRAWTRFRAEQRQATSEDVAQIEERHFEFHMALLAACGSPRLLTYARQLHAETQRYRQPTLVNTHLSAGGRDVSAEHEAIMQATLARDGDKAATLLRSHYALTAETIELRIRQGNL